MKDDTLLFLGAGLAAYFLIIKPEQDRINKLIDDFSGAQSALGNAFNFQFPSFDFTLPNFDFSNFNPAPAAATTILQTDEALQGRLNAMQNALDKLVGGQGERNEWGSGQMQSDWKTERNLTQLDKNLVSATFTGNAAAQQSALQAMYPYFTISKSTTARAPMSSIATPTPSAVSDGGALQYAAQDWNAQSKQQPASGTPAYAAQQAYYASQAKGGGPTFGGAYAPNSVLSVSGGVIQTDAYGNITKDTRGIINESAKREAERRLGVK